MAKRAPAPAVRPLLPVTLEPGGIRYAPGMRAGRWVFASGLKATAGFAGGLAAEVEARALPHHGAPRFRREADRIFRNLNTVLAAGGSDLANVVRVDQHYTTSTAVEFYHDARRATLKDHVPPSTSTLTPGLLLAGQAIEVHALAVVPDKTFRPVHIRPAQQNEVHATSGYSLALAAGDFVFFAGRYADAPAAGPGLAPEVRMPAGHLWKGLPIRMETEYVIAKKLVLTLNTAGCTLAGAVLCQVDLRDPDDFAPFMDVWRKHFPRGTPATTLVPTATPGFNLRDARIEINTLALRPGRTRRRTIDAGVVPPFAGITQAVRAGDLLFLSGLLAIDRNGLIGAARPDPRQPYFGSSITAQMDFILSNAEKLCRAAGTKLANVVRIQQYHTDLREFQAAYDVWARTLPGQHLPLSAVEVPFLPVPGCTVMLGLWVYAP